MLHPVRESQELSWGRHWFLISFFATPIVLDLDHTLCANREVLTVQGFLILNDNQVIRAVTGCGYRSAVAIQKFDWHVGTVLRKEADCLVTSLNRLHHMPARSVFADKVGLTKFGGLIVGLTFSVDDLFEIIEFESILGIRASLLVFFLFIVVVFFDELGLLALDRVAVHIKLSLHGITSHATVLADSRLQRR